MARICKCLNYNISTMKYLQIFVMFVLLAFTQCSSSNKAAGTSHNIFNDSTVQELINSKHYTFVAQYAQPLRGRQITLTTEYTLTVHNDSLISYLPYFGQAYVAPINPSDAGIEFTSTNFDYAATPGKKGSYTVTIKPKDEAKANQMILHVTSSGYADLQVSSSNRQAINFRGIMRK
jgi:hypothetical protein